MGDKKVIGDGGDDGSVSEDTEADDSVAAAATAAAAVAAAATASRFFLRCSFM